MELAYSGVLYYRATSQAWHGLRDAAKSVWYLDWLFPESFSKHVLFCTQGCCPIVSNLSFVHVTMFFNNMEFTVPYPVLYL